MSDQALQMQIQTLQKQVKELQALTQFIKVSGNQITIKASATVAIEAANININASGILNLKGSLIKLNNGSKPAAYVGSKTVGNQTLHTVMDGSPTVLLP